jgi:hypothetical protein
MMVRLISFGVEYFQKHLFCKLMGINLLRSMNTSYYLTFIYGTIKRYLALTCARRTNGVI